MSDHKNTLLDRIRLGETLGDIPIIDFHTHLGHSSDFYLIPRNGVDEVVAYMDRIGIDHIVSFPITISTDPEVGNAFHYQASADYPERISALTLLHAAFPQDWMSTLENGARNGARGIKLISAYQKVPELSLDWSPALDFANARKWVVLNHSWGTPERLNHYAMNFPNATFIIGHGNAGYEEPVKSCDNVYMCTCASFVTPAFASIEELWRTLPVEKILFGSDCLDLDFCTAIGSLAYAAAIPDDDKLKILGGNAVELIKQLGWDQPKGLVSA